MAKQTAKLVIPSGITRIDLNTFQGQDVSNIRTLIIPDTVTEIGDRAFYLFKNLRSITIPGSVTKIGESALPTSIRNLYIKYKTWEMIQKSISSSMSVEYWLFGAPFDYYTQYTESFQNRNHTLAQAKIDVILFDRSKLESYAKFISHLHIHKSYDTVGEFFLDWKETHLKHLIIAVVLAVIVYLLIGVLIPLVVGSLGLLGWLLVIAAAIFGLAFLGVMVTDVFTKISYWFEQNFVIIFAILAIVFVVWFASH